MFDNNFNKFLISINPKEVNALHRILSLSKKDYSQGLKWLDEYVGDYCDPDICLQFDLRYLPKCLRELTKEDVTRYDMPTISAVAIEMLRHWAPKQQNLKTLCFSCTKSDRNLDRVSSDIICALIDKKVYEEDRWLFYPTAQECGKVIEQISCYANDLFLTKQNSIELELALRLICFFAKLQQRLLA